MTGLQLHQNALAYSATSVAASLMNAVFQFYYVNLFLNVYRSVGSKAFFYVRPCNLSVWPQEALNSLVYDSFKPSSFSWYLKCFVIYENLGKGDIPMHQKNVRETCDLNKVALFDDIDRQMI